MSRRLLTLLTIPLVIILNAQAFGQAAGNKSSVCPTPLDIPDRPVVNRELKPGETELNAEIVEAVEDEIYHAEGNAEVTRGTQQGSADVIEYNQATETVDLTGNVNYWDEDMYLHSQSVHIEVEDETARSSGTEYRLLANRGRGKADELYVIANKASEGRNIDYTTCDPVIDGSEQPTYTWKLSAEQITLNHETNWGVGRNVVLKVKDIPVFYTPYISFPLTNDRKTGFLAPSYGNTRRNGVEIQTPFYWNISPNMDATFTPRLLSDSGLMLMGEYRYLFENGNGHINAEYLPSDSNYNDEDRSYLSLEHTQVLPHNGMLRVVLNNLSDRQYYEDFGPSLEITSQAAVDRFVDLSFEGINWRAFARVQDFQIITPRINNQINIGPNNLQNINFAFPILLDPYKRLPQIGFNYSSTRKNRALNYELDSEFVYFKRNERSLMVAPFAAGTNALLPVIIPPATAFIPLNLPFVPATIAPNILYPDIDGSRFDLNPSVSYPVHTLSSFIEPKVGVRYTAYNLDDASAPFDDTPDRLLPYASLDAGLFLERDLNIFGEGHTQTLEPRMYYLYVPHENQDDLPVFDTGLYDDSFETLFYENRYSGIDRINDANRITLSLTSRLINADGRESGHISIGQLFYLDEQDVTLPGQRIPDEDFSPLVFELGVKPADDLSLLANWQWEPNENRMQKVDLQARYHPDSGRILNFAYRVRRADAGVIRTDAIDVEQTDVSFRWPVSDTLNLVGRWVYALDEDKSLDIFGGLEYDSCCWGMRVVGRRFVSNSKGDTQTGIFFQFELKGLAGVGQKTVDFLYQNIPGYRRDF